MKLIDYLSDEYYPSPLNEEGGSDPLPKRIAAAAERAARLRSLAVSAATQAGETSKKETIFDKLARFTGKKFSTPTKGNKTQAAANMARQENQRKKEEENEFFKKQEQGSEAEQEFNISATANVPDVKELGAADEPGRRRYEQLSGGVPQRNRLSAMPLFDPEAKPEQEERKIKDKYKPGEENKAFHDFTHNIESSDLFRIKTPDELQAYLEWDQPGNFFTLGQQTALDFLKTQHKSGFDIKTLFSTKPEITTVSTPKLKSKSTPKSDTPEPSKLPEVDLHLKHTQTLQNYSKEVQKSFKEALKRNPGVKEDPNTTFWRTFNFEKPSDTDIEGLKTFSSHITRTLGSLPATELSDKEKTKLQVASSAKYLLSNLNKSTIQTEHVVDILKKLWL